MWNILKERLSGAFLVHSIINSCAVEIKVKVKGERRYKRHFKI
jgi:hypothetical protein